jgi:predicted ATP-grasp superfamily ATP-dependent carboligase
VLRNLKRPRQFFMLLEILKIPHPEVSFKPVISDLKQSAAGWLYKQGGGSGGTHVRKALPLPGIAPETGCYFQREIKGTPVSLLFVADGKQAKAIGFNQQWTAPAPTMPYRYGGAVANADLPDSIRQQLIHAAQQLTNAVGLRGLNSLDAIMDGKQLWVLEINPRLSATFDLYQSADCNLFELHIRASAGDFSDSVKALSQTHLLQKSKAHHIVYAPYNLVFPNHMEWPEWVADVPLPDSAIRMHDPVCTVTAEAETAEAARELVFSRRESLETILAKYKNELKN